MVKPRTVFLSYMALSLPVLLTLQSAIALADGGCSFNVKLGEKQPQSNVPLTGRLIVFVINDKSEKLKDAQPVDGPFWDDPQPLFGANVKLRQGETFTIDDSADSFPIRPSQLPAGRYRVQARFDAARTNSEWKREPGNLWSDAVTIDIASNASQSVDLVLTNVVIKKELPTIEGVEWLEVRSELLSKFRGQEVMLRAGVVLPTGFQANNKYAAIYEVPGFGGDHTEAAGGRRKSTSDSNAASLASKTFKIVLDPEGPNGHSLFVDSANNGPCGQALVTELIPALEAKYPLIREPNARLLRGHSSGGWSTLWLALRYPKVFGATWSSAPDPVDFRRFQKVDIYNQPNFYTGDGEGDLPSLRSNEQVKMTIRQEARGEDILGPDNISAQQWDSWFAAFGPRNASGNPAALFDPITGQIDPKIAQAYRQYDLRQLLHASPDMYLPIFRNNVRLICGTEDSFYLNEAVALLDEELTKLGRQSSDVGYVKLIPGDHGSIFGSAAIKSIPAEMLQHLRANGYFK